MKDYYVVLGLTKSASKVEIKKRYRELVQEYHPDKHHGNPLGNLAAAKFKEVHEAYEAIMDQGGKGASNTNSSSGNSSNSSNTYSKSNYNSNNYDVYINEMQEYFKKEMWSNILESADKAIQLDPSEPMLYVYKALAYFRLSQYQNAINCFNTAKSRNWNPDPGDLFGLALCHIEMGNFNSAIPIIEQVIKLDGNVPNYIAHLAYCYDSIGNKSQSNYYWNKLEQVDPRNEYLLQRKQSLKVGNQYIDKKDAAAGACWICVLLECFCCS